MKEKLITLIVNDITDLNQVLVILMKVLGKYKKLIEDSQIG
jgi:hypothetical protein